MTSATKELRRLLDERGVEYETYIEQPTGFEHVKWNFNEHGSADFNLEFGEPWLTMYGTISGPEQAIAATLCDTGATCERHGVAGTCKLINAADDLGEGTSSCMCSECGYTALDDWWDEFKYCPNCGRKVVDE